MARPPATAHHRRTARRLGYGPPPGYGPTTGLRPATRIRACAGLRHRRRTIGPPPGSRSLKPGIIPLRPLTLSDIFNGAVGYIRANPKATLGLTAIVVVVMQIVTRIAFFGPLAALRQVREPTGPAS